MKGVIGSATLLGTQRLIQPVVHAREGEPAGAHLAVRARAFGVREPQQGLRTV